MKKTIVTVPEHTEHLSDWQGFQNVLPSQQHIILNKKICGCGATEAFLRTDKKVILASPRKHLLLNKYEQHLTDHFHLFRFDGDREAYLSGTERNSTDTLRFKGNLENYIAAGGNKILTTYDSIAHIKQAIHKTDDWLVVVDEFQAIFTDSHYKAETEYAFTKLLQQFPSVVYLSATPFLETYLDVVEPFCKMEIIELQWPASLTYQPHVISKRMTKSIPSTCQTIINNYKNGNGETLGSGEDKVVSKEAVIYLNDVRQICSIIKKAGLKGNEVNIICASTKSNIEKLKKIGHSIGNIPKQGEPHKMFTFCTSTVYLGADFYSTSAYTYIFASPSLKNLTVDVGTDLQQILGRQRLPENPFKSYATLFYTTKMKFDMQEEDNNIKEKLNVTNEKLQNYEAAPNKARAIKDLRKELSASGHQDHYCSIGTDNDGKECMELNQIVIAAEKRAYEILYSAYKNDYSMYSSIKQVANVKQEIDSEDKAINNLYAEWTKDGRFERKMKLYCDTYDNHYDLLDKCSFFPSYYKSYHEQLGRKGLEQCSWREDRIKDILYDPRKMVEREVALQKLQIKSMLIGKLQGKTDILKTEAKALMADIYKVFKISIKAKANDIEEYIEVTDGSKYINGKKVAIYKIQSFARKNISVFSNMFKTTEAERYDIDAVLDIIRTDKYFQLKKKVEKVRAAQTDDDKDKAKQKLPIICYNGTFSRRNKDFLQSYSAFTAIDFDHFVNQEEMHATKEWLKTIPYVYAVFTTPSGKGLKAIVQHDNISPELHCNMYSELLKEFDHDKLDKSVSDLARGNFLSYDPDLWKNPSPSVFHFDLNKVTDIIGPNKRYVSKKDQQGNYYEEEVSQEDLSFMDKLYKMVVSDEYIINTYRKRWSKKVVTQEKNNTAMTYSGLLCLAGIEEAKAKALISEVIPDLEEHRLNEIINYTYKHNRFGATRKLWKKSF